MLILSRKTGERIRIGNSIVVTVVQTSTGGVRLGVDAPNDITILREELVAPESQPLPALATPPLVNQPSDAAL